MSSKVNREKRLQGGSLAIKGFLFQFDRTIQEIIQNPDEEIRFEQDEDIERQKYYIQIKEKSGSKYYPSSIRKAVEHLFDLFLEDETRTFCLYCHFQDKDKSRWKPSMADLDEVFGKKNLRHRHEKMKDFCESFVVEFSHNYEAEFKEVIGQLRTTLSLKSNDLAVMYHAVIRSYLLDLAVKHTEQRKASFSDIKSIVKDVRRRVTMDGYQYLLAKEKYEKVLYKRYFLHTRPNIDPFERLFVIECSEGGNAVDLMQLIIRIADMYFVEGKSPQPFILLRGLEAQRLRDIKRGLVDKDFMFNDGTWFDGDKVRAEKLFAKDGDAVYGKVKFMPSEEMLKSEKLRKHFDEIYEFHQREPLGVQGFEGRHIEIPVSDVSQTLRVLRGR